MVEISNKFIMRVLVVALIVIVTSVIITTSKISLLQEEYISLTGAATSTARGETNITITASTSLTNQKLTIDFGSGNVNASCQFCSMDSNGIAFSMPDTGVNVSDGTCCGTFNYSQTAGFLLENTGNQNLSVGYTCTLNCTFNLFIGGGRAPGMGGLEIKATSNSAAGQTTETGAADTLESCQGGGTLYRSIGWNITNSSAYGGLLGGGNSREGFNNATETAYISFNARGHWLCGNYTNSPLRPENSRDAAVIDINVTVPWNAPATGVRSSINITFNGTSQ